MVDEKLNKSTSAKVPPPIPQKKSEIVSNAQPKAKIAPKAPPSIPQKKSAVPAKSEIKVAPTPKAPSQITPSKTLQSAVEEKSKNSTVSKDEKREIGVTKKETPTETKSTITGVSSEKVSNALQKAEQNEVAKTAAVYEPKAQSTSATNLQESLENKNKKQKVFKIIALVAVTVLIVGLICSVLFITPGSKLVEKTLSFLN